MKRRHQHKGPRLEVVLSESTSQALYQVNDKLAIRWAKGGQETLKLPRLVIWTRADLSQQLCHFALKNRRELKQPSDVGNHDAALNA